MHTESDDLPPPVNHVFVDYENVHDVDPAIIESKAVHLTLLLGAQKTKLDAAVVEKLLDHAANVEWVRLTSSGRNALDFALAYYLGRAVLADPRGFFHIVSKDTGYDPLIEHLRSKHIRARRHDSFAKLAFATPVKPTALTSPAAVPKPKAQAKPNLQSPIVDSRVTQLLEHLSKFPATRPKSKDRLVSLLVAQFGNTITEVEALSLVEILRRAGHVTLDERGKVSYHLNSK